tara:strand:- start:95 stop:631 length:537 start_codon:yes stop_codon:yes gene_type:complete
VNIITIRDFYIIDDDKKEILLEDIFYSKDKHDTKKDSVGIKKNFPILRDRNNITEILYKKFFKASENIFGRIDLHEGNSSQAWSLCTNKDYWESVPHDHKKSCTINAVYYLQIPKIDGKYCGMIRFLVDGEWRDYQPEPYELIIMPNHLKHDTTFHDTEEWRISLNFEIKGGIEREPK